MRDLLEGDNVSLRMLSERRACGYNNPSCQKVVLKDFLPSNSHFLYLIDDDNPSKDSLAELRNKFK